MIFWTFLGISLPRSIGAHVNVEYRPHNLRVIVACPERRNCAFGERKRLIGNHQAWVNLFAATNAQAIGTRTVRRVEREVTRLELGHGVTMLGARQRKREQVLAFRQTTRSARKRLPRRQPLRPCASPSPRLVPRQAGRPSQPPEQCVRALSFSTTRSTTTSMKCLIFLFRNHRLAAELRHFPSMRTRENPPFCKS